MKYFKKLNTIIGWAVFAIAATVYLLTMEPSASLWDCAEFISTSYRLEVGHPPGAPLFMMISRLFSMFAPDAQHVAVYINAMSALAAAFTILLLFWSITHLARRLTVKDGTEISKSQTWTILGAGIVGALAYTFTDTFWFSAVEAEVYSLSSLFTAAVIWAMLRWEEVADQPHSNRWLVLIAYLMGLSIGVHILNLLTIPALVFVYYFRKTPKVTLGGVVKATLISGVILVVINSIIIPYTALLAAMFDRLFVNSFGLPINSGGIFFVIAIFILMGWLVWFTHRKGKVLANAIVLCLTVILLGYSSYVSVVIRAAANPPMNSNNPNNPYSLYYLLNRDQYGNRPLLTGVQYSAPPIDAEYANKYYIGDDGKYHKGKVVTGYKYPSEFKTLLPRMWSSKDSHVEAYKTWGNVTGRKISYNGEVYTVPTAVENMRFLFSYQLNFMYWRYFLWNFVGRQSDIQSTGEITDGQWLSGIKFIDELYLGPQDNLPSDMAGNSGRNRYFFLPFILGIIGLIFQLNRDPKNFTVVAWLFFMMGIALVIYFNSAPGEPRERDYVYAGSFYAFSIWIGLGVLCIKEWIARLVKRDNKFTAVAATIICSCIPIVLAAQNWDDHDRSHRYVARDVGYNYLESALPNSIVMNYGDNDTFPLWYNQEVEGVRPDIRVMNLSYLGAGWYIDQMRIRSRESAAVPFSLPRDKYTLTNDYLYVRDLFNGKSVDIKAAMDFVASSDPRTMVDLTSDMTVDYLPAKVLALPVNKQNAIESGVIKAEDADLMVDTIFIKIDKSSIDKPEMMLLDLLANFDWKRPLYFTQPVSVMGLGLQNYLQFDGYSYRLVPILTPATSSLEIGRVDADYLYPRLMEQFRYGNIADPRVNVDYFVQYNLSASQARNSFARLARALSKKGDNEKALAVLDAGVRKLPFTQLRHSNQTLPYIEAYYDIGATEKGDILLRDYARNLEEYVNYYIQFTGAKAELVNDVTDEKLTLLTELYRIAQQYGREEIANEIRDFFYTDTANANAAGTPADK